MLYTILFSLIIIICFHIGYKYIQNWLTPLKTKDVYTFHNDKVSELIRLLEPHHNEEAVDFSSMEHELSNLINNENDIKPTCDYKLHVTDTTI